MIWYIFHAFDLFFKLMLSHKKFRKERKNEFHFKLNTKKVR